MYTGPLAHRPHGALEMLITLNGPVAKDNIEFAFLILSGSLSHNIAALKLCLCLMPHLYK